MMHIRDNFTHLTDDMLFYELTEFQGVIEVRIVEIFGNSILNDCYLNKTHLLKLLDAIEDKEIEELFNSTEPCLTEKIKEINFDLSDEEWQMCFGDDTK